MNILFRWLFSAVIILGIAYVLPGVTITGFGSALIVALALGLINIFLRPLVLLLTLPLNLLTLGLFTVVVDTLMIMLAAAVVPGFMAQNFWWTLVFALLVSFFNMFLKD